MFHRHCSLLPSHLHAAVVLPDQRRRRARPIRCVDLKASSQHTNWTCRPSVNSSCTCPACRRQDLLRIDWLRTLQQTRSVSSKHVCSNEIVQCFVYTIPLASDYTPPGSFFSKLHLTATFLLPTAAFLFLLQDWADWLHDSPDFYCYVWGCAHLSEYLI